MEITNMCGVYCPRRPEALQRDLKERGVDDVSTESLVYEITGIAMDSSPEDQARLAAVPLESNPASCGAGGVCMAIATAVKAEIHGRAAAQHLANQKQKFN